jgi:uncharacterized protein (TIGR03083 family)
VPLTRDHVVQGLFAEYEKIARLVAPLDPAQWDAPTRCTGWSVRDVAGHVLGNAIDTASGTVSSRNPDEQARSLRDRRPASLAADLRATAERLRRALARLDDSAWQKPGPLPGQSVGDGVLTLWYDTVVHGDDIRSALGYPADRGPGLVAALECLTARLRRKGWGPARLAIDGMDGVVVGEGGPVLRGDPWQFVLVASGRADPATFGVDDRVNVYL